MNRQQQLMDETMRMPQRGQQNGEGEASKTARGNRKPRRSWRVARASWAIC